jgi:hypothetical protein
VIDRSSRQSYYLFLINSFPNLMLLKTMASSSKILSLNGKGLKLDTRADVEPWIKDIDPTTIEEIHMGGNTIGVDAATTLADFLAKANNLKVCMYHT